MEFWIGDFLFSKVLWLYSLLLKSSSMGTDYEYKYICKFPGCCSLLRVMPGKHFARTYATSQFQVQKGP